MVVKFHTTEKFTGEKRSRKIFWENFYRARKKQRNDRDKQGKARKSDMKKGATTLVYKVVRVEACNEGRGLRSVSSFGPHEITYKVMDWTEHDTPMLVFDNLGNATKFAACFVGSKREVQIWIGMATTDEVFEVNQVMTFVNARGLEAVRRFWEFPDSMSEISRWTPEGTLGTRRLFLTRRVATVS